MLELAAQPGGQSSQALATSAAHGHEAPAKPAVAIPSSFDIFAASFSTKASLADPYLKESFNIAKSEGWSDLNGDGGLISNNVRIMSKRSLKLLENRGVDAGTSSMAASVAMQGLPSSKFDLDHSMDLDHKSDGSDLMLGNSALGNGNGAAGGAAGAPNDATNDEFYRGGVSSGVNVNSNALDTGGGSLDGTDADIMSRWTFIFIMTPPLYMGVYAFR
jgi:hypothetical protein